MTSNKKRVIVMKKPVLRNFYIFCLALILLEIANEHAGQGGWLLIILPGILLFLSFKYMSDCFPLFGRTIRWVGGLLSDLLFFFWRKDTKKTTGAKGTQPRVNFRR